MSQSACPHGQKGEPASVWVFADVQSESSHAISRMSAMGRVYYLAERFRTQGFTGGKPGLQVNALCSTSEPVFHNSHGLN